MFEIDAQPLAGYTDIQLAMRDGDSLGRLVPGISRLPYLDWK